MESWSFLEHSEENSLRTEGEGRSRGDLWEFGRQCGHFLLRVISWQSGGERGGSPLGWGLIRFCHSHERCQLSRGLAGEVRPGLVISRGSERRGSPSGDRAGGRSPWEGEGRGQDHSSLKKKKKFFLLLEYSWFIMLCSCILYSVKWIGCIYVYVHSFSDSFPIQVLTEHWGEFPVIHRRSFRWSVLYTVLSIGQSLSPYSSLPSAFPSGSRRFVFYTRGSRFFEIIHPVLATSAQVSGLLFRKVSSSTAFLGQVQRPLYFACGEGEGEGCSLNF